MRSFTPLKRRHKAFSDGPAPSTDRSGIGRAQYKMSRTTATLRCRLSSMAQLETRW